MSNKKIQSMQLLESFYSFGDMKKRYISYKTFKKYVQFLKKQAFKKQIVKKWTLRKLLIPSILFVVILLFVCLFGLFNANASEDKMSQQVNKHYSSIVIQPKDNLWGIAERYVQNESIPTYIDNIKKLNNMNEDTIYAGKSIIVYYYE